MPPKVGRRPAAAALRGFRRPSRREPSPPQPTVRASLLEGKEVGVREVPLSEWETGRRLALKGVYWEEDCEFAGVLKALSLHDGIQELKMRLEGTKNEFPKLSVGFPLFTALVLSPVLTLPPSWFFGPASVS